MKKVKSVILTMWKRVVYFKMVILSISIIKTWYVSKSYFSKLWSVSMTKLIAATDWELRNVFYLPFNRWSNDKRSIYRNLFLSLSSIFNFQFGFVFCLLVNFNLTLFKFESLPQTNLLNATTFGYQISLFVFVDSLII